MLRDLQLSHDPTHLHTLDLYGRRNLARDLRDAGSHAANGFVPRPRGERAAADLAHFDFRPDLPFHDPHP